MSEWICVEDGLPDAPYEVLCLTSSGAYWICVFCSTNKIWLKNMDLTRMHTITHWMPLPEPPTKPTQN